MYQVLVYPITPDLWRWEIRSGRALLRCGTAGNSSDAEAEANGVVIT